MASFQEMDKVPYSLLEQRVEPVRVLQETDIDAYEIIKDKETGEHYLLYSYLQVNLSGQGEREEYHHFMPISSDDILGILFENEPYQYPEHWKKSYLRNGPESTYVWFDPGYTNAYEESERLGNEITRKLLEFKQQGNFDPQSMEKLMKEIDQLKSDSDDKE